ncbi:MULTISPECIES: transglutaminase family protein [unclassified Burkholderia]|uniref:transglutaminase family protein n=1 Tax=unclassified Burkholderia TaxID=2613784 RepID=UPI002AB0E394|nr:MULTISPECIES: transglutaminase family protein [unclassified Burkholderia]
MHIGITHTLRYTVDEPLQLALQRLRLRPSSNPGQTVGYWELLANDMQPELSYIDGFGNHVDLVCRPNDRNEIVIVSRGEVKTHNKDGVIGTADDRTNPWLFLRESPLTRPGDSLMELASALKSTQNRLLQLHELMDIVHDRLAPGPENCDDATDAEAAWISSHGTCRDHAHVFIAVARRLGIPARFTSGYLIGDDDGIRAVDHAWAEVYVDHLGWIGFDPANNLCPDQHYVKLATGIDACGAAPVTCIQSNSGAETLTAEIAVTLSAR